MLLAGRSARALVAVLCSLAAIHCGDDPASSSSRSNGSGPDGDPSTTPGGPGSDGGAIGSDGGPIDPGSTTPPDLTDVLPADRRTVWQPGIPGGIPARTTKCATLDAATYGNGAQDASGAIQSAINACPEGQVVELGPGTFKLASTITIQKGIVLRGAGSTGGGHPATILNRSPAGVVVQIGRVQSTSTADAGAGIDLSADAPKGATSITVASAAGIVAGDILQIDVVDDPSLVLNTAPYDCPYFKRAPNRSIGQRIEVASVSGNTLQLKSPLHWNFTKAKSAQIARINVPITRNAGLEGVLLRGGNHPYDGAGVNVWNAAYSWIRDIETDTMTGMHIVLSGAYRFVVRDSYVHHSGNYGYAVGCYGIVVRFESTDSLVENNISRYVNKPILFNASGGGNVVAYNYADDSWADPGWQEVNIDCHCNFPHMELIEGNFAPHMGVSSTHGNAGFLTFYRNYSSSQFHERTGLTGNVTAIQLDTQSQSMNVVGNVLGKAGIGALYEEKSADGKCGTPHVFLLGSGFNTAGCSWSGASANDPAITTLLRHGNFDYATNTTQWSSTIQSHTIPPSAYLSGRPAFWPSGLPWPWAGPDLTPMVGTLPAKDRFDRNFDGNR